MEESSNKPFSFGGEDETTSQVKIVAFCENLYQLEGILSTFTDSFNEIIAKVSTSSHPIGEFGAVKSGVYPTGYDYENVKAANASNILFISDVDTSKIRDNNIKELNLEEIWV